MNSILTREEIIIPLVAIISGCGIGAVAMVASFWYKLRVKQWEMSLKHSMLERGMSAEEIRTVLEASPKRFSGFACGSHQNSLENRG
jgi:hypothetical protein